MSPYVGRSEKHAASKRSSSRRLNIVIASAVFLSAASLALTVLAVAPLIQKQRPPVHSAEVVPAKLASAGGGTASDQAPGNRQEAGKTPPTQSEAGTGSPSPDPMQKENAAQPPQKKVPQTQKVVYLTFDDGPGKYTRPILDILDRYQIHGTFFMIGNQLSANKQAVKDAAKAGHYVGLHSMSHSKKKLYDAGDSANFLKEFTQEQQLVEKLTGTAPTLIRAPYGSKPEIDEKFRGDIAEAGFKMWDWTVDSKDWKHPDDPGMILKEVKRQIHRDTEVILLHEKAQTAEILPQVIEYLQAKGYAFAVYKPAQHITVNFGNDSRL
ncbi:polysaccharide deacetylase family protein [Paenibacillus macerans]|uniref:polysaccharide deacetylase family protein n=1 Tax=Paenibacillus macerans TaxID=44252 RepID=UPI003D313ED4